MMTWFRSQRPSPSALRVRLGVETMEDRSVPASLAPNGLFVDCLGVMLGAVAGISMGCGERLESPRSS